MMRLAVLFLLLLLPLPANASFYYICKISVKLDHFTLVENGEEAPDIQAEGTVVDSTLEEGHIEDPTCNFTVGQPYSLSTRPTPEEAETFRAQSRTLEKRFNANGYDLTEIKPGDILVLRYHFNNQRMGDTYEWTLLRVNGLLDMLIH